MAASTEAQISSASCSTHPGRGKCCGNSTVLRPRVAPSSETTSAVVPVVPWSRASRCASMSRECYAWRAGVHSDADKPARPTAAAKKLGVSRSGGLGRTSPDLRQYESCGACTPIVGCGWCTGAEPRLSQGGVRPQGSRHDGRTRGPRGSRRVQCVRTSWMESERVHHACRSRAAEPDWDRHA